MKKYRPHIYKKDIHSIDYKKLFKNNIHTILFDLDNTVVKQELNMCDEETIKLFNEIKKIGIKPILFSNSFKHRVKKVADVLNIDYVYFACKPLSFKFNKLIKKYNLDKSNLAIVGDQIFTDIKGGNKIGITTILVEPISEYENFIFTKINRYREKQIKNRLNLDGRSFYE